MRAKEDENGYIVLKLGDGEDVFECLNKVIEDLNIRSGFIILGIGMLADLDIGFFAGGEYKWKHLQKANRHVNGRFYIVDCTVDRYSMYIQKQCILDPLQTS